MDHFSRIVIGFACMTVAVGGAPLAQAQSRLPPELLEIKDMVREMCESVPLEQTSSGGELNAEAKAKLDGLLSKFVDLSVSAGGKKIDNRSKGVLQKDLAGALKDVNKCRSDMFKQLTDRFLGQTTRLNPDQPKRELPVSVTVPPRGYIRLDVGYLKNGEIVRVCFPAQLDDGQSSEGLIDFWLLPSNDPDSTSVGAFRRTDDSCKIGKDRGLQMESWATSTSKYSVVMRQSPNGLVGEFNKAFAFTRAYDRKFMLTIRRN